MTCIASRSEQYTIALLASILLYSMSLSVIAQDRSKEIDISTYKIKLSLSNLPKDIEKHTVISTQFNNSEKASLKISPIKNQNLLFTYLMGEDKQLKSKSLVMASADVTGALQPVAYISSPVSTNANPQDDKKIWDTQIKAKYRNGLIRTVAPGIKHINIRRHTKAGPMNINIVEVNP